MTLIEKKERDKRLIKNWRPISLMNVDAKIASKAIAMRMKNVISSIIKSDQTAYMAGRYIGESIHLINDILEYVNENELSGILFSADFEKHSIQLSTLSFLQLFNLLDLDQNLFSG